MARHLSAAELLDLAERAAETEGHPHLASCSECRAQLDDVRAALALIDVAEVPEPSPLFWDHLSGRIHDAVAREQTARAARRVPWLPWRLIVPIGAAAAVVVAIGVLPRLPARAPANPPPRAALDVNASALDTPIADDASLSFVADLASDLDLEDAAQAGFAARPGAVDGVLPTLSASETAELQRLLTQALTRQPTRSGA
jgi:hypothetical protein